VSVFNATGGNQLTSLKLIPPLNRAGTISCDVTAQSVDTSGDFSTASASFTVNINAVADTPQPVSVKQDTINIAEDTAFSLSDAIAASSTLLADRDGSESLRLKVTATSPLESPRISTEGATGEYI
jgi:hypothetical protein